MKRVSMGFIRINCVSVVLYTIITFIIKGEANDLDSNLNLDVFSRAEAFLSTPIDIILDQSRDITAEDTDKKNDSLYFKITPRILLIDNELVFNEIIKEINGITSIRLKVGSATHRFPFTLPRWDNKSHFLFDIHDDLLITHIGNSVSYTHRKRNYFGSPYGSIQWLEFVITFPLDSLKSNYSQLSKSSEFPQRGGYLTKAFQSRQNGDTLMDQIVTLTRDSILVTEALAESWYDFHIDKKGKTHAFVYIRGELIYLLQKKASQDPGVNTWKEIFSMPATDDIGPFTSVTVKGKQYLFTQDGTILKKTGKTMEKVGKLPGDLRNTSVVWDKEKDKMWYITKEEFDAYKAGDAKILNLLNKIQITGNSQE